MRLSCWDPGSTESFSSLPNGNIPKFRCLFFAFLLFRATGVAYEIPKLGVKSELQLQAYAIAIATWDPSRVCNLYHSSWILNPLSEAEPESSWILVGFISTEPQWDLFFFFFFFFLFSGSFLTPPDGLGWWVLVSGYEATVPDAQISEEPVHPGTGRVDGRLVSHPALFFSEAQTQFFLPESLGYSVLH